MMVSSAASMVVEFDNIVRSEEDDLYSEPHELKYTPPEELNVVIKTEVYSDDDGYDRGEDYFTGSVTKRQKETAAVPKCKLRIGGNDESSSCRRSSGRARTRARDRAVEDSSFEECDDKEGGEYLAPKGKVKKSRSTSRKSTKKDSGTEPARKRTKTAQPNKTRQKPKGPQKTVKDGGDPNVLKHETDGDSEEGSRNRSKGGKNERSKEGKRNRRANMTPEEREAEKTRAREQARLRRAKLRNVDDPEAQKKLEEQRAKDRERTRLRRAMAKEAASGEEFRKLEEQRTKQREKMRQKRAMLREAGALEDMRAKSRDKMREIRELAKKGALPEEKLKSIQLQKEKDKERKRAMRAAMTPEQKRELLDRNNIYKSMKKASLDEDEKRARQIKAYMSRQAKLAEETREEREARKAKDRIRGRLSYHRRKDTLDRDKMRERQRQWWHGMDPGKKSEYLARYKETYRKRIEKLKEDPEKWAEVRKRWTERDKLYRQDSKDLQRVRKRRSPKRESGERKIKEPGEKKRRKPGKPGKKWTELTDEQKKRYNLKRRQIMLTKKLAIQKLLDSGMSMEEVKQQTETKEQRERRCILARIRKARRDLRTRLQSLGVTPEEIKQREEELKRTYQPTKQCRPYRARPDNWKRVDVKDIVEIEKSLELTRDNDKTTSKKGVKLSPQGSSPPSSISTDSPQKRRGRPPQISQTFSIIPPALSQSVVSLTQYPQPHHNSTTLSSTMPTLFPCPQLNHPHSQQYEQATSSSSVSHYIYPSYPQNHPSSAYYSQQSLIDGGLPYSGTYTGQASFNHGTSHYDTTSTTSSQHEYNSSYHGGDDDHNFSPPASPPRTEDDDNEEKLLDCSYFKSAASSSQPQQTSTSYSSSIINLSLAAPNPAPPPPPPPSTKPLKKDKPKPKRRYKYRPPKNPNAKRRSKAREFVCEECGELYSRKSLVVHKKQQHNENYDKENRTCRICGEKFNQAHVWYSHYYKTHYQKVDDSKPKPYICDLCGVGFMSKNYLHQHKYYQHGDGQKKENFYKCPVCPGEKLFKQKSNFSDHMRIYHCEVELGTHECYRCDKAFPSQQILKDHVKDTHPDSYFPCPDCNTVRFTELGLLAHFRHAICSRKIEKNQKRLKESFSIDKMNLACELCDKKMTMGSLYRHYRDMHLAPEGMFKCLECVKEFKHREFWAIHMEEKHQKSLEEVGETVRMLNLSETANKDKISIIPLWKIRKEEARKKVAGGSGPMISVQGGGKTVRKPGGGRRKKKCSGSSNDDNEEEDDNEDDVWKSDDDDDDKSSTKKVKRKSVEELYRKKKKRRRKVIVIADEDECVQVKVEIRTTTMRDKER